MSRKPENTFRASVHRHLPRDLYSVKMNNPFAAGIADDWYSGKKADLWVEYKFVVLPKRDTTLIHLASGKDPMLSALQQDWLHGRYQEGRNVAVIVGCKEGGVIFPNLEWASQLGYETRYFRERLRSRQEIASWITHFTQGGP